MSSTEFALAAILIWMALNVALVLAIRTLADRWRARRTVGRRQCRTNSGTGA